MGTQLLNNVSIVKPVDEHFRRSHPAMGTQLLNNVSIVVKPVDEHFRRSHPP